MAQEAAEAAPAEAAQAEEVLVQEASEAAPAAATRSAAGHKRPLACLVMSPEESP